MFLISENVQLPLEQGLLRFPQYPDCRAEQLISVNQNHDKTEHGGQKETTNHLCMVKKKRLGKASSALGVP